MEYVYIFDTSAVKGVSRRYLEPALKKAKVSLSPLTIYELICHVDETKENEDTFARRKGNLLKCSLFNILPDPFVFLAGKTGIEFHKTRLDDPFILKQVLEQLRDSNTLAEFYSRTVDFSSGEKGEIQDVALRARDTFAEENSRYIEHIKSLHKKIVDHVGYDEIDTQAFFSLCAWVTKSLNQENKDIVDTFSATYIYAGYKLARLLEYQEKVEKNHTELIIDKNDTEDSLIASYLDLDEPYILVTEDKGTISAIYKLLGCLDEINGWRNKYYTKVIRLEEFYKEVGITMADET